MTILGESGLYLTILNDSRKYSDYTGKHWIILNKIDNTIIQDYLGLYQTKLDYTRLYKTIPIYNWTLLDYTDLNWSILDYTKQYLTIFD